MICKFKKSFEEIFLNVLLDGIDLLKKLFQFNFDKRLIVEQVLSYLYVVRFYNFEEELLMDYDVIFVLNDDVQLSVEEYRVKFYEVSLRFNFSLSVMKEFSFEAGLFKK